MLVLLGTTLTTSFFDSLNPSAIAQQMLLQAMVKNKRQIWFFIFGIGLANLAMGLAIYYGVAAWASRLLDALLNAYPLYARGAALAAGAVCLCAGVRLLVKTRRSQRAAGQGNPEAEAKVPAQLSSASLFAMGAAFCLVELTSALPYFGFLAVLAQYRLAFLPTFLFILLYDFMYVLPLILLYFGYNRLQGTAAIQKLERVLGRVSAYLVPVIVNLAGVLLAGYGAALL